MNAMRTLLFGTALTIGMSTTLAANFAPVTTTDEYIGSLQSLSVDLWGQDHIDVANNWVIFLLDSPANQLASVDGNYLGNPFTLDISYAQLLNNDEIAADPSAPANAATTMASWGFEASFIAASISAPGSTDHEITANTYTATLPGIGLLHFMQIFNRLDEAWPVDLTAPDTAAATAERHVVKPRKFFPGESTASYLALSDPCANPDDPQAPQDLPTTTAGWPCGYDDLLAPIFCQLCNPHGVHFIFDFECQKVCCDAYQAAMVAAATAWNSASDSAWTTRNDWVTSAKATLEGEGRAAGIGGGSIMVAGLLTIVAGVATGGVGAVILIAAGGGTVIGGGVGTAAYVEGALDTYNASVASYNASYCTNIGNALNAFNNAANDALAKAFECLCMCCELIH